MCSCNQCMRVIARLWTIASDRQNWSMHKRYAQLRITQYELYVELHTDLMHRFWLWPQPLLIPLNNNFLILKIKSKSYALTLSIVHKPALRLALVNGWESFGNTHPKGGLLKKSHIPQVLPIYHIWLGFGATYIGRIRTWFCTPCRQGLKVLHLPPRAPCRYTAVSLRGFPQHAT